MATKSTAMSLSDMLTSATVMSANIKLNEEKMGRFGLEMPTFTNEMDADIELCNQLNQEQERLKSVLKAKTEELNGVKLKIEHDYSMAKKTIKLAEPQVNWIGYGITDKK
jgi:hypothetical protein